MNLSRAAGMILIYSWIFLAAFFMGVLLDLH